MSVDYGYHSFNNMFPLDDYYLPNYVFIIPKEAKYINGKNNSISKGRVSSTIICAGKIINPFTWLYVGLYLIFNSK